MEKTKIDKELKEYLDKIQWHTPYSQDQIIEAYNLAKSITVKKIKDKAIIYAGDNTAEVVILLRDLENLK
jgi:3'-phosphoadenosine 5'-phosphosulfate (PAPS) 3'-phosphatase